MTGPAALWHKAWTIAAGVDAERPSFGYVSVPSLQPADGGLRCCGDSGTGPHLAQELGLNKRRLHHCSQIHGVQNLRSSITVGLQVSEGLTVASPVSRC